MPIESQYLYISDLDKTSPGGNEEYKEGDDHIRGVKSVLTNQFPNLGSQIVTPTADQINQQCIREVGYGGMSLQQPDTVITYPTNGVWMDFDFTSGATVYPSKYATGNPATGIITLDTLTVSSVRVHAVLSLRREDNNTFAPTEQTRCRIKRLSNDTHLETAFITQTLPDRYQAAIFVLEGLDLSPQAVGEQYIMEVNQGDNSVVQFRLLNYNFWVEPIGSL